MTVKKIVGKASFHLVRFLLFLSRILPLKVSYAICNFAASAGTLLKWKRKQIALANLAIVFPKMTDEEKQAIFRESLVKTLKNYFEICFFTSGKWSAGDVAEAVTASGSAGDVAEAVTASGLEYLDDLIESGKGALLYSGHIGNFPLMMVWLAMKGYPVAAVYKEAKNFPDDFFGSIMSRFNVTPLKYKSDPSLTTAIIRLLKEKKIVLLLNDQSHPAGVYINFFNKSVPSLAGPAFLTSQCHHWQDRPYCQRD